MAITSYQDMRALALDSDPARRALFADMLDAMGFGGVLQAGDTEQARDALFFSPCHVIVMGSRLSPCPAGSVIAAAMRDGRLTPAVIVVQSDGGAAESSLTEAGAHSVLPASADVEAVEQAVHAALSGAQAAFAPTPSRRRAARLGRA